MLIIRVCRWVLLEVLDKVSPGSVNWKQASKPPIKMPFRKVENCNQVIRIGKLMKFSLVNVGGNDIVQGNKKLILGIQFTPNALSTNSVSLFGQPFFFFLSVPAFLWQLMRFNMLQLLKNLRFRSRGKEISDNDILSWANKKVRSTGRTSHVESFKVKCFNSFLLDYDVCCQVSKLSNVVETQDKSLSSGLFFLKLLSAVEPRVVNWNLVTKGESGMNC